MALNDTLEKMDLFDILRPFHPKAVKYTYSSRAHAVFSMVSHMLGHKMSLNKFEKAEIIPSFFSDHTAMELEINQKKYPEKHTQTWKPNNTLLNDQ